MKKYANTEKDFNKLGTLMKQRIQMLRSIIPDWDETKDLREINGCLMAEAAVELFQEKLSQNKTLTEADFLAVGNLVFGEDYKHLGGNPKNFAIAMAFALIEDQKGDGTWYGCNLANSLSMSQPICGDVNGKIISTDQIWQYTMTIGF